MLRSSVPCGCASDPQRASAPLLRSMADVSSGVLSATSTFRESATAGLSTAAKTAMATSEVLTSSAAATMSDPRATLSTMGAGAWAVAGSCGGGGLGSANGLPGRGARSADEEDSQSGGEDGGKQGPCSAQATSWGTVASRLGLGSGLSSRSEKEQLVPKEEELEEGRRRCGSFGMSVVPASLSGGLSSLGSAMGMVEKPKEPETRCAALCRCCPALSYQQRMVGFVCCFALGGLLSLSALSSLGGIFLGNPAPFAVKYTLGNLLSIGSSSFLVRL